MPINPHHLFLTHFRHPPVPELIDGQSSKSSGSIKTNRHRKLLLFVLLTLLGTEACADMYSYEDKSGTMVFTDNPAKVPLKRKNKRVSGTDIDNKGCCSRQPFVTNLKIK